MDGAKAEVEKEEVGIVDDLVLKRRLEKGMQQQKAPSVSGRNVWWQKERV